MIQMKPLILAEATSMQKT